MADPITAAIIVGLAAQKFAEGAAGKSAEKLVERLWDAVVDRFKGKKKTEENLAAIAAGKPEATDALKKVATVLEGEFVEDEEWRSELEALAQQIITIQNQSQSQKLNAQNQTIRDEGKGYQFNDIQRIDQVGDR